MGGRLYPKVWRMREAGKDDRYTQLTYSSLVFKPDLPGIDLRNKAPDNAYLRFNYYF